MGNSRNRFSVDVQIAACQMYMGNPDITQQEVCDHFGMAKITLNKWLRKHDFSLKSARRKPMPTKAARIASNFKVLKTEHTRVKAELMQLKQAQQNNNSWISDKLIDMAQSIIIRSN